MSFDHLSHWFSAEEFQSFEEWLQDEQLSVNECFENPERKQDIETSMQRLTVSNSEVPTLCSRFPLWLRVHFGNAFYIKKDPNLKLYNTLIARTAIQWQESPDDCSFSQKHNYRITGRV